MKLIFNKIPRLHLFVIQFILLMLVVQSLLRIGFFIKFTSPTDPSPLNEIIWSFYLGVKYDLQFTLLLSLPLLLSGWIKWIHPVYSQIGKKIWLTYFTGIFLFLFLFHAANFGFYSYLGKSVDASSMRFLKDPLISAGMVWETYPVITGTLIILTAVLLCILVLNTAYHRINPDIHLSTNWKRKTGIVIITFFLVFFGLLGKASWYPLRWSDAFFSSSHPFTAYLASNPVMYFYNTLKNRLETFDINKTREHYPLMVDYLGIDKPDIDNLNYTRHVTFENKKGYKKPNVVIVVLESFASYKSGLSGNPMQMTPNIDSLAKNGKYFKNFFVPDGGTARSIWALMTSLPDIEKRSTSTRNPLIVNQKIIMNSLEGYKKFYFLGGSVSWGNIRGLLTSSIDNLEIYEEGSYEEPRVDVWGISDLSLFKEANKVFKETNQPFFSVVQTSGNHRPYTIPDDNDGFKILSKEQLGYDFKEYGFRTLDEVNAFRFMDHSVGRFIAMAKQEDYFDNTIFMFFGDHGIGHRTGKHTPRSEDLLLVSAHRVPYIIYAPKLIGEPEVISRVASSIDVMPTAASLTKTDYINTTLGRDLFDSKFDDKRYAYTIHHHAYRRIGLLSENFWFKKRYSGGEQHLYQLGTDDPRKNLLEEHPKMAKEMEELVTAINETTKYIRENNSKY